ncbi:MAG: ABC transporter permease [Verrucomicrobia bacterium]|nr:ABC transporter permease [Verrucomicrobiota bacterium]
MLPAAQKSSKRIPLLQLLLPWEIARHLRQHGWLIQQLAKREVLSRYRGSYLGILGSLVRPVAMFAIYAVVFGFIFQSKLGPGPAESKFDFALALFCGLVVYDFFADCLGRAPMLVLSNPNFVTKVVFPLEVLTVSTVGAALIQFAISLVPLLGGLLCVHGAVPLTALYLPVILLPLVLLCLGATWFLASVGVFVRDINAIVPAFLTIVMFASAIFYSLEKVPAKFLPLFLLNPLAVAVDQARNAVLWGVSPAWPGYFLMLAIGLGVMGGGYAFFMRTKRAFADVM